MLPLNSGRKLSDFSYKKTESLLTDNPVQPPYDRFQGIISIIASETAMKLWRTPGLVALTTAMALGFMGGTIVLRSGAQDRAKDTSTPATSPSTYLTQSPGARVPDDSDYGLGDNHASKLKPYPQARAGDRTPFDLHRYAGRGASSWKAPILDMSWDAWYKHCTTQKPKLMADCRSYMNGRFNFEGKTVPGARMRAANPSCRDR